MNKIKVSFENPCLRETAAWWVKRKGGSAFGKSVQQAEDMLTVAVEKLLTRRSPEYWSEGHKLDSEEDLIDRGLYCRYSLFTEKNVSPETPTVFEFDLPLTDIFAIAVVFHIQLGTED